jgi:hypothetical protein
MYQRDVAVGDHVTPGQRIALMGDEGEASSPKIHLGTYAKADHLEMGEGMNPIDYLAQRGLTLPCTQSTSEPSKSTTNTDSSAATKTSNGSGAGRGARNG